ncbi:MAG: GNAT family N-acetyltransferase [Algoriphagus sp.]|jgi:dTDP-4-amino-4,6-dideoxy-D-galactose acyltransferase|uniref:GNAT family N-acetyltransferase n=1 Tax=Algoriphagus sp. TaxID=1872435 RepID=UPI0027279D16|nr:GNAT family N-acetyltransferase [Algoriphagus sp.]MDO8966833.1 GNAT family N-acetyltransferase [Algoriphagus sp.]MDP2041975.1 GNAT family N-acetyltransferase [Algoriphagus sp.]MDP3199844.1 GNAT family N-acetyltransferase [Algoriphagus sp.]MDP3471135.1 GNAT family N-acetyltransferase [Algoriphagus sp.]
MIIQTLAFDSQLFGYPVGKFQADKETNWDSFLEKAKPYQLIYVFSETKISNPPDFLRFVNSKYVFGKKLTEVRKEKKAELTIESYSGALSDKLLDLALQSGEYSRFKTDPRLSSGEYEKLYRLWIEKALLEDMVLVDSSHSGLVTLSVSDHIASIGLIAVDVKSRGLGIGKALLRAAEEKAITLGAIDMKISTQGENRAAVQFYKVNDYQLMESSMNYHFFNVNKLP